MNTVAGNIKDLIEFGQVVALVVAMQWVLLAAGAAGA